MTADVASATTSNEQTGCNTMDSEKLQYLDRQNLQCPAGKVMNSFRVVRSGCNNPDMRYAFACVGVPPPPTPAPTPAPTPSPEDAEIYGDPHGVRYDGSFQPAALLQHEAENAVHLRAVREGLSACTAMDGKTLEYL